MAGRDMRGQPQTERYYEVGKFYPSPPPKPNPTSDSVANSALNTGNYLSPQQVKGRVVENEQFSYETHPHHQLGGGSGFYEVLCVRAAWPNSDDKPRWWPVLGPQHEDREFIQFAYQHFHVDFRFLDAESRGLESGALRDSLAFSRVITSSNILPEDGRNERSEGLPTSAPTTGQIAEALSIARVFRTFIDILCGPARPHQWSRLAGIVQGIVGKRLRFECPASTQVTKLTFEANPRRIATHLSQLRVTFGRPLPCTLTSAIVLTRRGRVPDVLQDQSSNLPVYRALRVSPAQMEPKSRMPPNTAIFATIG